MTPDERAALVDKLASIRRRADGATPGPWRAAHKASYPWPNRSFVDASGASVATTGGTYGTEDDAEFIAASRTDIPALLAIIDGQADRLALAEKTIEGAPHAQSCQTRHGHDAVYIDGKVDHYTASLDCTCWKAEYDAAKGAL